MSKVKEGNTYAKCTDYERIFNGTYWGRFTYSSSRKTFGEMTRIVENRNNFIKSFDIKSSTSLPLSLVDFTTGPFKSKFDHTETYKTKYGEHVIITSPYREEPDLIKLGFQKYRDMYSADATTYILVIDNLKTYVRDHKHIMKP